MLPGFRSRCTTNWRCAYSTAEQTSRNSVSRCGTVKRVLAAIVGDLSAVDVLHHDVGQAVLGSAAVEQTGDVGMLQPGQRLPFAAEAVEDQIGVHAAAHQLDRDLGLILIVVAFGEIDGAHAAAAEFAHQPVWAHTRVGGAVSFAKAIPRPASRCPR